MSPFKLIFYFYFRIPYYQLCSFSLHTLFENFLFSVFFLTNNSYNGQFSVSGLVVFTFCAFDVITLQIILFYFDSVTIPFLPWFFALQLSLLCWTLAVATYQGYALNFISSHWLVSVRDYHYLITRSCQINLLNIFLICVFLLLLP